MQHKSKKNAVILLLAIISLVASMFLLSACDQSTDKSESYFDTSGIASTKCEYDSVNNTTKVVWASTLTNGTIYNIKGVFCNIQVVQQLHIGGYANISLQHEYKTRKRLYGSVQLYL